MCYNNTVTNINDNTVTVVIILLEAHMHSLEANRPGVFSQRSVIDVADCHILVASEDIDGAVYPQILM